MELLNHGRRILKVSSRLPCWMIIANPLHEVLEAAIVVPRIKDLENFPLRGLGAVIVSNDWRGV